MCTVLTGVGSVSTPVTYLCEGVTMRKSYTYATDKIGGVILSLSNNNEVSVYLQGDDANIFLDELKETEKVWDTGTDMCKDILKRNFVDYEGHVSYIISQYF